MKELLYAQSVVTNPLVWILVVLVTLGLVDTQIRSIKSLRFEDRRADAKKSLISATIVEFIIVGLAAAAIYSHSQLMTVNRSMFRVEQDLTKDLTTVELKSKTPILIGTKLQIVRDEDSVLVVQSRKGAEYRIEKRYINQKKKNSIPLDVVAQ